MDIIEGKKYTLKRLLQLIQNCERPLVYVNACTHGKEKVGAEIIDALATLPLLKGTLLTNIANRKAFQKNVRFIKHDLNRVFPGNPQGNYEEKLAYELLPIIQTADVVIDIHSTDSHMKGSLIVTHLNEGTRSLIRTICPQRVLVFGATKKNALISNAKIGIAFEYGKDTDHKTFDDTLHDIVMVLKSIKMIETSVRKRRGSTECYKVNAAIAKQDDFIVDKRIRNFRLVRKGDVVASNGVRDIRAKKDFYPVLFGETSYTTIFGFMGEKINL